MSNVGTGQKLKRPSAITTPAGGAGPPPVTGALSTQFNATFGPSATAGLGMLNLIMFG